MNTEAADVSAYNLRPSTHILKWSSVALATVAAIILFFAVLGLVGLSHFGYPWFAFPICLVTLHLAGNIVRYRSYTPGADTKGSVDSLSVWAGQSVGLVSSVKSAGEIVREIAIRADAILRSAAEW